MQVSKSTFHDLPAEIQRDIFELAAEGHRGTATQLALVSKPVQNWIEWSIYHTIVLDFPRKRTQLFLQTLHSRPSSFFATRVQRLYLTDQVSISDAHKILSVCTGVSSLACWAHPGHETGFKPLLGTNCSLSRLSIRIQTLVDSTDNVPFHHSLFRNLTHLDIVNPPRYTGTGTEEDEETPKPKTAIAWESLCLLPKLRHVTFGQVKMDNHRDIIVRSLPFLLRNCVLLEHLVVLTTDERVVDVLSALKDSRCRVLPYFNYPKDLPRYWEDVSDGGADFWDSSSGQSLR
ncbi:hypothetical protein L218DRAFT_864298 [Marasmius fiardii PR-910]|nr:hypothetical protein L218DRAFT_864298 [Marasmius fiardii PR-910]